MKQAIAVWAPILVAVSVMTAGHADPMPADYQAVLTQLGKSGDFKDNTLKVNIPRDDLQVAIDNVAVPTSFGFGGWVAMAKCQGGDEVLMGDLVLLEDEVNPVMSALLDHGIQVTGLHNHFFFESPRVFFMHVHGMGPAADLATRLKPAMDLIDGFKAAHLKGRPAPPPPAGVKPGVDTAQVDQIIGHKGEDSGAVHKITIGRDDLDLTEVGAKIGARMGLNTWAAFYGTDQKAMIAGDIAMLEGEVNPVLVALRRHDLEVVAVHQHMLGSATPIVFLHYWGQGPAARLAEGFRAAIDQLGPKPAGMTQ